MNCPKCQIELFDGAKFCFECSLNLQAIPVSKHKDSPEAIRTHLTPEPEPKHVAAPFSDLTGYKAATLKLDSKKIHRDLATRLRVIKDEIRFQWVAYRLNNKSKRGESHAHLR